MSTSRGGAAGAGPIGAPSSASSSDLRRAPTRRSFLLGSSIGAAGLLAAVRAPKFGPPGADRTTVASPDQQEHRGDAFHGDLGMWPIIWSVPTSEPAVSLTFDDGPDPEFTPRILEILRAHGVRATFNMMGWNCVHHPEIAAAVVADGHEIGNHTWSHLDLAKVDAPTALDEIRRGREAIEGVTKRTLTLFRPPRGELSGVALRYAAQERQSILMWTVNGGQPTLRPPAALSADLVRRVRPGFIVDLHDGIGRGTFDRRAAFARELAAHRHNEVEALDAVLTGLAARGMRCVTVSELLELPRDPRRRREPELGPAATGEWEDDGPVAAG